MPDYDDLADMEEGEEDEFSLFKPDQYTPPAKLPEGVKKTVVGMDDDGDWSRPKTGDEVCVHYVGTLKKDGSVFDSSRGKGQPLHFILGRGQAIKGLDLGVASMEQGEVAVFEISSDFAYGAAGSPELGVPPNCALSYEVELLSFGDDILGNGLVYRNLVKRGTSGRKAQTGDAVLMSYGLTSEDGSTSRQGIEYVTGAKSVPGLSAVQGAAADEALCGLKAGAVVLLRCPVPGGGGRAAELRLTLEEVLETADAGHLAGWEQGILMVRTLSKGHGQCLPRREGVKVSLRLAKVVQAGTELSGEARFEFVTGEGEVCDALEGAVGVMRRQGVAVISAREYSLCVAGAPQLSAASPDLGPVDYHVELLDFTAGPCPEDASEAEQVDFAAARKERGSEHFRAGRWRLALGRYQSVLAVRPQQWEDRRLAEKLAVLQVLCRLNTAACCLKLCLFAEAKRHCDEVAQESSDKAVRAKALFRRAQALVGLCEFRQAMQDCKRVLELQADNREARSLFHEALRLSKEGDAEKKELYATMMK